ncbi:hypothetical protein [uncultured Clostridium sp.]|uniref:hypothetical protein n=1 Tax=uncultured Clostridium sp. TaxID=59620 RepID=UPI0025F074F7|nr:hypothetical protein [uncultured Clostridium sp.]
MKGGIKDMRYKFITKEDIEQCELEVVKDLKKKNEQSYQFIKTNTIDVAEYLAEKGEELKKNQFEIEMFLENQAELIWYQLLLENHDSDELIEEIVKAFFEEIKGVTVKECMKKTKKPSELNEMLRFEENEDIKEKKEIEKVKFSEDEALYDENISRDDNAVVEIGKSKYDELISEMFQKETENLLNYMEEDDSLDVALMKITTAVKRKSKVDSVINNLKKHIMNQTGCIKELLIEVNTITDERDSLKIKLREVIADKNRVEKAYEDIQSKLAEIRKNISSAGL